jgi:2,4-diaminopentanoate dehydrogenase
MTIRVIQWASGNVGRHAAAAVARRRGMKLVGMYVYSPAKDGMDAGLIAGVGPLGVRATTDAERIVALDADVVIHAPLPSLVYGRDPLADLEVICRLLASGKNVVSTVGYMYPKVHGARVVRKLTLACRKGGVSFHSTGLNPGWMGDLLPLSMTALSGRIDLIQVREISNFQYYPSPEIMFEMMGFGKTETRFRRDAARYGHWLTGLFRESVQMVADGLGLALDRITHRTTRVLATEDFETAAGTVRTGTVAGQRWEWSGVAGRRKRIVHETVWRMHEAVAPEWPTGNHSITISGEPNMRIDLAPNWIDGGLLSTAMHAVNAVPLVCAASPGICTPLDLPRITGRGLFAWSGRSRSPATGPHRSAARTRSRPAATRRRIDE